MNDIVGITKEIKLRMVDDGWLNDSPKINPHHFYIKKKSERIKSKSAKQARKLNRKKN